WVWDNALSLWYKDSSQLFYYSSTSSIGDSELPHLFVRVFPNPCHDQLFLDIDSKDIENANYQIFSVTGKLIDAGSFEKTKSISVEKIKSGLYLVQAQFGNRIYMGKFIKN
ncbi:MAG: T9SS type A sorting domain-containing protein, partial [Bacteroidetes bacterium]|nr:T9SS type A sorting domain-containing protein [Bacteroidota bacterium]